MAIWIQIIFRHQKQILKAGRYGKKINITQKFNKFDKFDKNVHDFYIEMAEIGSEMIHFDLKMAEIGSEMINFGLKMLK